MKKILITGAGGFIGGRLVEVLKETMNPDINILLRNIEKAARISTYPLNYFKGSITNEESLNASMQGCDTVVHCAHDFANPEANLLAANLIANHCLQHGIKKLIYISSFAVHRSDTGVTIDEQSTLNEDWDYAINKSAIERTLIACYHQFGLPVIILRPTIVYGPFSAAWTTNTVTQMLGGRVVIPFNGERICNAVYIDDVVNAIIKALQSSSDCNGKSFIVSGPDAVTWKEYYNSFLLYAGINEPVFMNLQESEEWNVKLYTDQPVESKSLLFKDPISFLKKTPVYGFYKQLLKNPSLRKKLLSAKAAIPRPLIYPSKETFENFSCIGTADISKIKSELGFQPRFFFQEGIKKTLLWVDWANLNCDS
jgi:nucleoside-diphosphate-sugar epimerase